MSFGAWPTERAKHLFFEVNARGHDLPLASVTRDGGVEFRADLDISVWNPGDDISNYKRVCPGDFVIGLRSFQSGLGYSPLEGLVSPAYSVLRPRGDRVHAGYFRHLLKSSLVISMLANIAQGIRQGRTIAVQDFNELHLPVPPARDQRAIADYLDRETARTDALIAAKRGMIQRLEERWQGTLEIAIQSLVQEFGETRLKYVCREIVVGIVITPSAWYADSGVLALRGTNVTPGEISLDDVVYLTPEGDALHLKSRLRSGDVVVVRTGQAGAAAVVPSPLDGVNCIDLVIVRPSNRYSPHFLEFVLNSNWTQQHVDKHSVGTIQSHFNVGAASSVPVPLAPLQAQNTAVEKLRNERESVQRLIDLLRRQIALLQEHRQTLITAAVTGEVEVPVAA